MATPKRNYSAYDVDELFTDMGLADGIEQRDLVANLTVDLRPPAGLPVYCLHGINVSTPSQLGQRKKKKKERRKEGRLKERKKNWKARRNNKMK